MKLLYTNENLFLVTNVKNLMQAEGLSVFIKNEFSQGAIGEISAFDAWPEVWLYDAQDYNFALSLLEKSKNFESEKDWNCSNCSETNAASFEICWNCRTEKI